MKKFLAIFLLCFLLTSCAGNSDIAIEVDGNEITVDSYGEELNYFLKILKPEELNEEFYINIADTIVLDKIIELDLIDNKNEINDNELEEYSDKIISKLGSKEDLTRSVESHGLKYEDFEKSLKKSANANKHYEIFKNNIEIKEADLEKFFNKNKENIFEYKIADIMVQSKGEGEGLIKELGDNNSNLENIIKRYNDDSFEGKKAYVSDYINRSNPLFIDDNIMALEIGEKLITYYENNYHVIILLDKLENYEDLVDQTREEYIKREYLSYINELCKEYDVMIYKNNIKNYVKMSDE